MTAEQKLNFLVNSPLFADCAFEQIQAVARTATIERYPIGATIIKEDTRCDYFYLIVEGAVDIFREEKHFLLDTLSSGAVFGIMSLMERKP